MAPNKKSEIEKFTPTPIHWWWGPEKEKKI